MKKLNTRKNFVIYHSKDNDGLMCRAIAKRFLIDPVLIGWNYGEDTPAIPDDCDLYIMDLHVPTLMTHPNLVWIDHHETAIAAYPETIAGLRIDGVAACRLAWQWFIRIQVNKPMPRLEDFGVLIRKGTERHRTGCSVVEPLSVKLAGQYDIWDKEDPRVDAFQFALKEQNWSDDYWDVILANEKTTHEMISRGMLITGYQKEIDRKTAANAFDIHFAGLKFCALNGRYGSAVFESALRDHHDACMSFFYDGKKWTISMYHKPGREDLALNEIAKRYTYNGQPGGGHRGACGFSQRELPFAFIPTPKSD